MIKLSFIFGLLAAFIWSVCLVLLIRYCTVGFWGYPDVWESEKAEKAYMCLAPISMVFLIISLILIIIAL